MNEFCLYFLDVRVLLISCSLVYTYVRTLWVRHGISTSFALVSVIGRTPQAQGHACFKLLFQLSLSLSLFFPFLSSPDLCSYIYIPSSCQPSSSPTPVPPNPNPNRSPRAPTQRKTSCHRNHTRNVSSLHSRQNPPTPTPTTYRQRKSHAGRVNPSSIGFSASWLQLGRARQSLRG